MGRSLIGFLAVFYSLNAWAVYSPGCGAGQISVGGACLTTTNLKILHGTAYLGGGAGTLTNFSDASLGSITRASGYSVPAAKTFTLYALKYQITNTAGAGNGPSLVYCDNDPGQDPGGTTCTNGKGMMDGVSTASTATSRNNTVGGAQNTSVIEKAIGGQAATGKYPALFNSNVNAEVTLYGYEIP